jgi:hypothetical protein
VAVEEVLDERAVRALDGDEIAQAVVLVARDRAPSTWASSALGSSRAKLPMGRR